jgi:phage/plasmid primase-like uncharacterized protein
MICTATTNVKAVAAGRWREVARAIGIGDEYLSGRHGPCPKCGGNDRWRVYEDFDQSGGGICNQCGTNLGDGLELVKWFVGVDFPTALKMVAEHLGMSPNDHGRTKSNGQVEDAITLIARAKHIPTRDAVLAYGAKAIAFQAVVLPVYGPDGK